MPGMRAMRRASPGSPTRRSPSITSRSPPARARGRAAGWRGAAGRRRGRLARARAAGRIERDPAFRSLRGARRARRARARQVRPRSAGTAARLAAGAGLGVRARPEGKGALQTAFARIFEHVDALALPTVAITAPVLQQRSVNGPGSAGVRETLLGLTNPWRARPAGHQPARGLRGRTARGPATGGAGRRGRGVLALAARHWKPARA